MNRPAPIIAPTVATPLLLFTLFGAYLGIYYAIVRRDPEHRALPWYGTQSELVEGLFAPAHQLDRLIRPDHWRTPLSRLKILLNGPTRKRFPLEASDE